MREKISVFLLLAAVFIAAPQRTEAQFWKKKDQKVQPKKPRPVQRPAQRENPSKKKFKIIEYPESKIKSKYRVDVLLPLYLDELVKDGKPAFKDRIPEKAVVGMGFYEGVKLAADTLSVLRYNIDVFIHDITDKKVEEIIRNETLSGSDLIIGALQSNQLALVADFAKRKPINFISALSPSDANIRDNAFFTLLQPRLEKHCARLIEAVLKKHLTWNVIVLYRDNNSVDSLAYSYITGGSFKKILLNELPQKQQLQKSFDSTRVNVVVMPIVDNLYADSVLLKLAEWFPQYDFEAYGMPSWKFMNSLKKPEAYPNIVIHFTSPFNYDFTTSAAQEVLNNHKKQFGTRPSETVFRGYETLFWYAYMLHNYGTVFNTKMSDNSTAPFTKFEIKPQWDKRQELLFNENERIYLYRYQGGSHVVEP